MASFRCLGSLDGCAEPQLFLIGDLNVNIELWTTELRSLFLVAQIKLSVLHICCVCCATDLEGRISNSIVP